METYVHNIDPFAIHFWGDVGIRWYGLAYLAGFVMGLMYVFRMTEKGEGVALTKEQLTDFTTWMAIGTLAGGRLGYAIFYSPELLTDFSASFPFWGVFAVHKGGMASHGGITGIIIATVLYSRIHKVPILHLMDLTCVGGSLGIFLGRIANFINGELYGRAVESSVAWAVKFPQEMYLWSSQQFSKLYDVSKAAVALGEVELETPKFGITTELSLRFKEIFSGFVYPKGETAAITSEQWRQWVNPQNKKIYNTATRSYRNFDPSLGIFTSFESIQELNYQLDILSFILSNNLGSAQERAVYQNLYNQLSGVENEFISLRTSGDRYNRQIIRWGTIETSIWGRPRRKDISEWTAVIDNYLGHDRFVNDVVLIYEILGIAYGGAAKISRTRQVSSAVQGIKDFRPRINVEIRTMQMAGGGQVNIPHVSFSMGTGQSARTLNPTINTRHIFHGEFNHAGRATGFHHRGSVGHHGKARISKIYGHPNEQGVYKAKVELFDPSTGQWVPKGPVSTFFPDNWSRARVLREIRGAFQNQMSWPEAGSGQWRGISPSGMKIGGTLKGGDIKTAYPFY